MVAWLIAKSIVVVLIKQVALSAIMINLAGKLMVN